MSPSPSKARPANRGLGRGLDALLGDSASKPTADNSVAPKEKTTTPDREVPIEFLRANPDQPRKAFHDDAIADLAQSIREKGLLQPILVRPVTEKGSIEQFEIVAGERRWRAAQKAQLHKVPVIVRSLSDRETAEIALIENIQRVDLNAMEEAEAYHHLSKAHDRTQQEIADAVAKSRSHVANLMRLIDLPPVVQNGVRENIISMGHARALLASDDPARDFGTVKSGNLSVRETESLIKRKQPSAKQKPQQPSPKPKKDGPKDADTRALERNRAEALGLTVAIDHQKNGTGSIEINYLNLDQLDDVCRRLLGSAI